MELDFLRVIAGPPQLKILRNSLVESIAESNVASVGFLIKLNRAYAAEPIIFHPFLGYYLVNLGPYAYREIV